MEKGGAVDAVHEQTRAQRLSRDLRMTDADFRPKASAGLSAGAVSNRHAAVRLELAAAVKGRRSPAKHGARTTHAAGAGVETVISRTVRIDPLDRRAGGEPEDNEDHTETPHAHTLALQLDQLTGEELASLGS